MAETVNYQKRIKFLTGEQRKLIDLILIKTNLNPEELATLVEVSPRTIRDWRREKYCLSYPALKIICKIAGLPIPKNIVVKDPFWGAREGARKGWETVVKKYGYFPKNEVLRKKKWYEWWEKEGRSKQKELFKKLPFKKPKPSIKLAEFFGIMMGDGGMSKFQITITLNKIVDYEYSNYVVTLIEQLFKVRPSKIEIKNTKVFRISVSRVGLIEFFTDSGLAIGNKIKQQIDIPDWIKSKFEYRIACLRGLVDTDGCLIIHRYKSNDKLYTYKKIGFTSRSLPLLESVRGIFDELGLKHHTGSNFDIRIEAIKDVKKYFEIVGTHNPKHLKRYLN